MSNQSRGLREERLCPCARSMTQCCRACPRTIVQADPMRVQLGGRLTRSAPVAVEEYVHLKYRVARQHVVDSARQLVG